MAVPVGDLPDEPGFNLEGTRPCIPADQRPRIFDLGHTRARDGTGFGLRIVEDHGWEISLPEGAVGGVRFELRRVAIAD